jgi:hypothetical protein
VWVLRDRVRAAVGVAAMSDAVEKRLAGPTRLRSTPWR